MILTDPIPFTEAADLIRNRPPLTRALFDLIAPELQAASFVITGVEDLHAIERVRNIVAGIPEGEDWDEQKQKIIDEIKPWIDDDEAAEARAELLLRSHGFAAYSTANYRALEEQRDIFTWRKYQTAQDERVRGAHAALNGVIAPADSPFWRDHTPPWDFGCRCDVVGLTDDDVEELRETGSEIRTPDGKPGIVIVEPGSTDLDMLEQGYIERDGQINFVARDPGVYQFDPAAPMITAEMLEGMKQRVGPKAWAAFVDWSQNAEVPGSGTAWEWLEGQWSKPTVISAAAPVSRLLKLHRRQHPPVSESFIPSRSVTAQFVTSAAEAIEKVHGDGVLPRVKLNGRSLKRYSGWFHPGDLQINVNPRGPWPKLTAVHELGHFLDWNGFGSGSLAGSETLPEFDRWLTAVENSAAIRNIATLPIGMKDQSYYRSKREMWARSYAQYIAVRSGDPELLQGVAATRSSLFPDRQWTDADFAPIAEAMDELFENRNWKRP